MDSFQRESQVKMPTAYRNDQGKISIHSISIIYKIHNKSTSKLPTDLARRLQEIFILGF